MENADPDLTNWPQVVVSIWPFSGHPTAGKWPLGWLGIDNTGTVYVCTGEGSPGTWAVVGGAAGSGWPTVNGSGAGNLNAETGGGDTVGYQLTDQGSGGFVAETTGSGPITLVNNGTGTGPTLSNGPTASGPITLSDGVPSQPTLFTNNTGWAFLPGTIGDKPTMTIEGGLDLEVPSGKTAIITGLPTSDPLVAGALWNSSGAVHVSAG